MKRMFSKRFVLVLLVLLTALSFAACSNGESGPQISGRVEIIGIDAEVLLDSSVSVSETSMASDAIIAACQAEKMAYTYKKNMFDGFGGQNSTQTDGWLLYLNGEQAQVGAGELALEDGFVIGFYYENYDEALLLF